MQRTGYIGMKNNDWFRELLRERFWKTRRILHPLMTLVLFNLAFLLVYGFVIGEKPYLYAADVSPDGTKIAFSSMEEGKLWCYSSDGTLRFAHTFTSEETAGGAVEVSCADDSVTVYTYRTEQLITYDLSGEKVSQEDAPKERGNHGKERRFVGWTYHAGEFTIERNGYTYRYYRSYWMVRFFHRERQVTVTDPAGNTRVLWTMGG